MKKRYGSENLPYLIKMNAGMKKKHDKKELKRVTTLPIYLLFCTGWLLAFAYAIIREKEQQNGDMTKTIIANLLVFVILTPIILSINV